MANLDKNAIINLQNDAYLENTYNTNIVFSTADQNSDMLRFKVLKNDGLPYIIGNVNVGGKIKLDHEDGSFWIDELKVVENELKYQFEYQLPNELLQRNGKVTVQVLVYEKGNSNLVVAQRKFTFTIQNSIYQNISAEDKTTYIMEFAQLEKDIRATAVDINETLANGSDYVTQIKTSHREGLEAIQTLTTSTTDELNKLGAEHLKSIQTTANNYLKQIDTKNAETQKRIDDFKDYLISQDVVLVSDTNDWQKYKLTNDNGQRTYLKKGSFDDVLTLNAGFYETITLDPSTSQGLPEKAKNSFVEIDVYTTDNTDRKQIRATISASGDTYERFVHTNSSKDTGWLKVVRVPENENGITQSDIDTGINKLRSELKGYTDNKHKVLFDGNASGVDSKIKLQDDYTNYNMIVLSGSFPGGEWTKPHLVSNTRSIHVTETNLVDDTAAAGGIYELVIQKTDARTLTIALDNYIEIISNTPHTNANKFIVERIEGFSLKGVDDLTPVGSDKYATMTQLLSLTTENKDWKIETDKIMNANTLITAIHGGGIEPGTTELAKLTSEISKQNYYSFNGIRSTNNTDLHVTSTRYDEPTLLGMLNIPYTVSIHGASGKHKIIYLGGKDTDNMKIMSDKLTQAGFNVQTPFEGIEGGKDNNIGNKNSRNKGIQLELTTALRKSLFVDNDFGRANREDRSKWTADMTTLATAISDAIKEFKN